MFNDYKGLSKDAKYLIYAAIFPSLAYGMFYTDLPFYLPYVQGVPQVLMGTVVTLMGVSAFFASISLGIAADKYGRKKLLIIGNILASVIIAVFALTSNPAILLTAAAVEGISEGAFAASANALLAEKAGDAKRNSAFSLSGFASTVAFGAGSIIILFLGLFTSFGVSDKEGHILIYFILSGLSLASTLIILKITETKVSKKVKAGLAGLKELIPKKSRSVLVRFVLTSSIIAFGAGLIIPLMSDWMKAQYGIGDKISLPILGLSNIVIGVATLAAPLLARKIGCVNAIVVTQGISTLFMFTTPLSPDYITASLVYTSRAFLMNMANPLQQSMIMGLVAEDERGAASGVSAALWRLPNSLSSVIGAFLIGIGQLSAPFFLAGCFYIASIALFWYFFRNVLLPEETTRKKRRVKKRWSLNFLSR